MSAEKQNNSSAVKGPKVDPMKGSASSSSAAQTPAQEPTPKKDEDSQESVEASDLISDPIKELQDKLEAQESKYKYLLAEMDNLRKRTFKERADLLKFGWEPVAHELVLVMDNFDRALQAIHAAKANCDSTISEGVSMVQQQLKTALGRGGVEGFDSLAASFDPNFHEAISQEHSEKPEGSILQETVRGYKIHGRLLRPARVVVSLGSKKPT